jgi:hypothetical protein
MSKLIRDKDEGEFFVGYADAPKVDRRFMLGLTAIGIGAAAGLGGALAASQMGAGQGDWDMRNVLDLSGHVTADPFPILRTTDLDGNPRTVLLACMNKCGAQDQLASAALADPRATLRGSLIQRPGHAMMTLVESDDWITPASNLPASLSGYEEEDLGEIEDVAGEILDSKCWFGAMRPNTGPVHKACAQLCIMGGLAPYFTTRHRWLSRGGQGFMITNAEGGPLIAPILPHVADPVRLSGRLHRIGDLIQLRINPADIRPG